MAPISFVKLPHSEEVAARVATHSGVLTRDCGSQIVNDPVGPTRRRDLLADVLAELPIELHHMRVDRLVGTPSSRLDKGEDLVERTAACEGRSLMDQWCDLLRRGVRGPLEERLVC